MLSHHDRRRLEAIEQERKYSEMLWRGVVDVGGCRGVETRGLWCMIAGC
jgi:hypothetical protein